MTEKILYIARHAKSNWHETSDFERPLTPQGKADALIIANILKAREVAPQLILSSPAKRAKDTAKIYQNIIKGQLLFDTSIYEASHISLRYIVNDAFEELDSLMLVGHNPGLTMLNDMLCETSIFNLVTASVVGIEFEKGKGLHKGKQLFFEYPKKYKR